jgi:hypothetical protein
VSPRVATTETSEAKDEATMKEQGVGGSTGQPKVTREPTCSFRSGMTLAKD